MRHSHPGITADELKFEKQPLKLTIGPSRFERCDSKTALPSGIRTKTNEEPSVGEYSRPTRPQMAVALIFLVLSLSTLSA